MTGIKVLINALTLVMTSGLIVATDIEKNTKMNTTASAHQPVVVDARSRILAEDFEDFAPRTIEKDRTLKDTVLHNVFPEVSHLEEPNNSVLLMKQAQQPRDEKNHNGVIADLSEQNTIIEVDQFKDEVLLPLVNTESAEEERGTTLSAAELTSKALHFNLSPQDDRYKHQPGVYYQDFGDPVDVDPLNDSIRPDEEYDVLDQLEEEELMLLDNDEIDSNERFDGTTRKLAIVGTLLNDPSKLKDRYQSDKQFVSLHQDSEELTPKDFLIDGFEWFAKGEELNDGELAQETDITGKVRIIKNTKNEGEKLFDKRKTSQQQNPMSLPLRTDVSNERKNLGNFEIEKNSELNEQPVSLPLTAQRHESNERLKVSKNSDLFSGNNAQPVNMVYTRHSQDGVFNRHPPRYQHDRREPYGNRFAFSPKLLAKFNREPFKEVSVKQDQGRRLGPVIQWRRLPEKQEIPTKIAMSMQSKKDKSTEHSRKTTNEVNKVLQMAKENSGVNIHAKSGLDIGMKSVNSKHSENLVHKDIMDPKDISSMENAAIDELKDLPDMDFPNGLDNLTFNGEVQQHIQSNGTRSSGPAGLRGHHISILRLVLEKLSVRQFTWWDLLIASSITIGCMLFLVGLAAAIQLCVRHCGEYCKLHCCCSRTEYSPSIKQASSNGTIYDVDYTLDSLRMINRRRGKKENQCIGCWWGFTTCCKKSTSSSDHSISSSPSLRSVTDVSVVSADMGTQYEHSDAMISSFVTNDLIVELNDRDSTCTSTTEGFEYYGPEHGGASTQSLGRDAHRDYKIGVTQF